MIPDRKFGNFPSLFCSRLAQFFQFFVFWDRRCHFPLIYRLRFLPISFKAFLFLRFFFLAFIPPLLFDSGRSFFLFRGPSTFPLFVFFLFASPQILHQQPLTSPPLSFLVHFACRLSRPARPPSEHLHDSPFFFLHSRFGSKCFSLVDFVFFFVPPSPITHLLALTLFYSFFEFSVI